MKTPREIILERHRAAEDKLAGIRPEELAALARISVSEKNAVFREAAKDSCQNGFGERIAAALRTLPSHFWQQSVYPWRHVWAGIAAVWLGILALNSGFGQSSQSTMVQSAPANPQVMAVLYEQKVLLTQLLGPAAEPAMIRPTTSGPRSEQRQELFIG